MILKRHHSIAASVLLVATGLFGHVAPVHAGDVSNAQLTCFVDTNAFEYPTVGSCASVWTPGTASNPTAAIFGVEGLPAGSYTFTWIDRNTGQSSGCSSADSGCFRSIDLNQTINMAVIVIDTQTNVGTVLVADASFYDGYN